MSLSFSQDIEWDPKATFGAVFDIDALHAKDGVNYELSKKSRINLKKSVRVL